MAFGKCLWGECQEIKRKRTARKLKRNSLTKEASMWDINVQKKKSKLQQIFEHSTIVTLSALRTASTLIFYFQLAHLACLSHRILVALVFLTHHSTV